MLARWSGWGAVPEALDERREDFAWARTELAQLLSPDELRAATRNTLNAHYTDLSLVAPTPQVPARRAVERDEDAIAAWRATTWAKVRG